MTVADQLVIIADNTSAVAEAVNASKTTVSGAVIRVDDVLHVEHPIKIQSSDGTMVKVYGKNLIKTESVDAETDKNKVLFNGSITGAFVFSCLFNYTECKTPAAAQFEFIVDGAKVYQARGSTDRVSKKLSGTITKVTYLNWGYGVGTVDDLQLEVGTTASDYEPFTEQVGVAENGEVKGLKAVSPTMTIWGEQMVECKYFPASAAGKYEKYQQLKAAEIALAESIKEGKSYV